MRFRNFLGLLAIGGAAAYAYKKRGGDLSVEGIKKSLKDVAGKMQNKAEQAKRSAAAAVDRVTDQNVSPGIDDRRSYDDIYSSGYGSSYPGNNRSR